MDNLKWTRGYTARFGTVYVDCATQKQIIKDFQLLV
ncbi:MAG: family 1 glycosylhydrolase [Oscillospiraceae bacterium]|nr:family 1 glycosylhydrolase [Oscillospiraceae bacterium]